MAKLNEQDRIRVLMMKGWGPVERSHQAVADLFNLTFRQDLPQISKSTVSRIFRKFQQHGTVKDLPKTGRPTRVATADNQLTVALGFIENPHLSLRRSALINDINPMTVSKIMKKILKFHPYKIHFVQELQEDDPQRRLLFCENLMEMVDNNQNFLQNIVFTDEATFMLHGKVNHQNFRYWSDVNPHEMHENHTQYPQKLNVWAGILNNQIIGPFFIEGNLTAARYLEMLTDQIIPAVQAANNGQINELWFQQDGAPPHWGVNVRHYLDQTFPQRWIGRGGPTEWPPRSPDLTPLDFFLWGYLKTKVYSTPVQNLQELRARIEEQCALIDEEMIIRVVNNVYQRLAYCQEVDGRHFEHLL